MSFKLTYFDLSGLALPIRLAFVCGGVQYEDIRVARESWPELKPNTPLGQMPLLEFDGKTYTQSSALLRYVAAKAGLSASATIEEKLVIDEICYLIDETFALMPRAAETPEALIAARVAWQEGKMTTNFKRIEEYINKSKSGFASPSGISIADFKLTGFASLLTSGMFDGLDTKILINNFPGINRAVKNVLVDSKIKTYFDAHPTEAPIVA